tara:strand:+ start:471 stop:983 length:513 start_codon:yes stop_codon:yes gene_type:complete
MSSIIRVNDIQDAGGNSIISSNGSGTFSNNLGVTNTPMFLAFTTSELAVGTSLTKVIAPEVIDTDNSYDPSNGRFTVPSGKAGKYYFSFQGMHRSTANDQTGSGFAFYKNGSIQAEFGSSQFTGHRNDARMYNYIFDLSVGDYIESYAYVTGSATTSIEKPVFLGYKLIT